MSAPIPAFAGRPPSVGAERLEALLVALVARLGSGPAIPGQGRRYQRLDGR